MSEQKVLLIVNPVAGRKKAIKVLDQMVDSLYRNNCKPTVFTTTKEGEATSIVTQHAHESERIICCGGDGTLNEIITGLVQLNLQIPVGYIPTGTTNDLAHSLNLPMKIGPAIEVAANGRIKQHDIGEFNENRYFTYVASFGTFASVSYSTPQWLKNIFGHMAYILKGALSIVRMRAHKVKVIADGDEFSGDFIHGSVSNSRSIGGVVKFLESDISFDDGKFEVLLIKKPKRFKDLLGIIKCVFRRRYDNQFIHFFKASNVSFAFEKDTDWTVDGEYAGKTCYVLIKNLARAAQVITA